MMLRYCANLKAIRYESTSLNTIVADKSHRVIVALIALYFLTTSMCYVNLLLPDDDDDEISGVVDRGIFTVNHFKQL